MRPGFRLCLLGGPALVLFALILVSRQVRTMFKTEPHATVSVEPVQSVESQERSELTKQAALRPAQTFDQQTKSQDDEALNEEKIAARIGELRDLARKTDHASLETLLAEMRNPDQEIRQAVLDIISQSGNRD